MHYTNIKLTTIGLGFLVGITLGATACRGTDIDYDHCARNGGDTTCMAKFGSALPYCAMCGDGSYDNDGCVEDKPTELECYSPCGDMQSSEENSSCIAVGEGNGDGDGDGDDDGDGDGDGESTECAESADCADPAMPFCDLDSGKCVDCAQANGDASCADLNADMPVCAGGMCVQCDADAACTDDKLICKLETNTCVECVEHEHCSQDSACNLDMGTCIEQPNIMHVDGSGEVDCDMRDGTEPMPYCTLGDALSKSSGEALIFIHAKDSGAAYQEVNTVNDTIVLFGVENGKGDLPILLGINNNSLPVLVVEQGGNLSLRSVQISGSDAEGLRVAGNAWIERSLIVDNDGGGIVVDGGTLIVANSFVGGDQDDTFAVNVMSGSATMTYVTLAAGDQTAAALICADDTTTIVRNSLLVAQTDDPELQCTDAEVSNSALEQTASGNVALDPMDTDWFKDYGGGDFHLTDKSPEAINTAAKWKSGDPVMDIDGDPRPKIDDSADFAGADVPL